MSYYENSEDPWSSYDDTGSDYDYDGDDSDSDNELAPWVGAQHTPSFAIPGFTPILPPGATPWVDLQGSQAQINWAESIRRKAVESAQKATQRCQAVLQGENLNWIYSRRTPNDKLPGFANLLEIAFAENFLHDYAESLKNEESAAWFINNRDQLPASEDQMFKGYQESFGADAGKIIAYVVLNRRFDGMDAVATGAGFIYLRVTGWLNKMGVLNIEPALIQALLGRPYEVPTITPVQAHTTK
jgi:hypothetical protein